MDYSLRVRHGQRVGHLNRDRERALELQRLAVYQLAHVAAGNVLHRDEVDAVDDVEIEDGADVGVIQRRGQARLALKAFQVGFFGSQFFGQNFDDHRAAQFGVDGFIDRSLPARAELLENLVIP